MNAIWILLGLAVLFGGAILVFVVRAVRHDDAGDPTPADTEVGRFSRDLESDHEPDGTDLPIDRARAGTEVGRFTEDPASAHVPEAAGLCAGRGTEVQS